MDLVFLISKHISLFTFHRIETTIPVTHPSFYICDMLFILAVCILILALYVENKYSSVEKKVQSLPQPRCI